MQAVRRSASAAVGGLCYHVLNRGNGRAEVVHKPEDFDAFLDLLVEAGKRMPMRILDWCWSLEAEAFDPFGESRPIAFRPGGDRDSPAARRGREGGPHQRPRRHAFRQRASDIHHGRPPQSRAHAPTAGPTTQAPGKAGCSEFPCALGSCGFALTRAPDTVAANLYLGCQSGRRLNATAGHRSEFHHAVDAPLLARHPTSGLRPDWSGDGRRPHSGAAPPGLRFRPPGSRLLWRSRLVFGSGCLPAVVCGARNARGGRSLPNQTFSGGCGGAAMR